VYNPIAVLNSFETFNVFLQVWRPHLYTVLEMRSDIGLVKHIEVFPVNHFEMAFDRAKD